LTAKENIILIGGGGHCRACIDVIEAQAKFQIAGIIDIKENLHRQISDYEIIGCDEDLPGLIRQYKYYLITIGQIKNPEKRKASFDYIRKIGGNFPAIISPFAYVSNKASIGDGTIIMHNTFINTNAAIGSNCIINTGAIIEHDVKIEDNCHISTGAIVNGQCSIGECTFLGSGSTTTNNITITKNTVVGACSCVVDSITESGIYTGIPAKKSGKNE
jgi:sugar O-acyltransferase (sialic acid O-acetyltransferase NeuD family)